MRFRKFILIFLVLIAPAPSRAATVLCVGDSQTGVWTSWGLNICQQLATLRPELSTQTLSYSGQKSEYIGNQLLTWLRTNSTPNYVVLLAGVNDYAGGVGAPASTAATLWATARYANLAGVTTVFVIAPPPVGTIAVPKQAHSAFTRSVASELARLTWSSGTVLVDARYDFELIGWSENTFPTDGVHLLTQGSGLIAQKLADAIP